MQFGLCNAPATFQRTMNLILDEYTALCQVYIDDIVVHSKTQADHEQHLRQVLTKLREEKFYAKKSKCLFAVPRIDFCGFTVSAHGVETQPDKIETITKWKTPTNVKEVRAFLGICGFYQRFIKNYAKLAAPLTELLKNTTTWRMGDAELRSIEQLKAALRESATLSFPNPEKDYHIFLNTNKFALGATLNQN